MEYIASTLTTKEVTVNIKAPTATVMIISIFRKSRGPKSDFIVLIAIIQRLFSPAAV